MFLAAMFVAFIAVPTGVGAKPERFYGEVPPPFVVPAAACPFDFLDLDTFLFTSFSFKGTVVDVCAELAD